jgi:hypothetical protein
MQIKTITIQTIEELCQFIEKNNLPINDINLLLKQAGINALIVYEAPSKVQAQKVMDFHKRFGSKKEKPIFIDISLEM